MSSVGPDVLTSCGQYGRILTVGREYILGIGGICNPISAWTLADDYSDDELNLQQASTNLTMCDGASVTALYSITVLLAVVLVTTSLLSSDLMLFYVGFMWVFLFLSCCNLVLIMTTE